MGIEMIEQRLLALGEGVARGRGLQPLGHQHAAPMAAALAPVPQPAIGQGCFQHLKAGGVAALRHGLEHLLPERVHSGGFQPLQHRA